MSEKPESAERPQSILEWTAEDLRMLSKEEAFEIWASLDAVMGDMHLWSEAMDIASEGENSPALRGKSEAETIAFSNALDLAKFFEDPVKLLTLAERVVDIFWDNNLRSLANSKSEDTSRLGKIMGRLNIREDIFDDMLLKYHKADAEGDGQLEDLIRNFIDNEPGGIHRLAHALVIANNESYKELFFQAIEEIYHEQRKQALAAEEDLNQAMMSLGIEVERRELRAMVLIVAAGGKEESLLKKLLRDVDGVGLKEPGKSDLN